MIEKNVLSELDQYLVTRHDKLSLLQELQQMRQALYQSDDWQDAARSLLPIYLYRLLIKQFVNLSRADTELVIKIGEYLDQLVQQLESVSEIKLTLSFFPTYDDLARIKKMFYSIWLMPVVLDWSYDPICQAGMKVYFRGKLWDLSLSEIIAENLLS